jgi:PAS domain S-box-containing protein
MDSRLRWNNAAERPGNPQFRFFHKLIYGDAVMRCSFRDRAKALHWTANAIREITRPTEQLEDGAERMRSFVEQAPVSISMFGSDMRYVAVSRRWKSDRGLSDVNLAGRTHCEFFPSTSPRWKEVYRRGFSGETLREELDLTTRLDGSLQWMSWEMWPWHTAAGDIGGIVVLTEYLGTSDCASQGKREEQLLLADVESFSGARYSGCLCEAEAAAPNDFAPHLHDMLDNMALIEGKLAEALDRAKASADSGDIGAGWPGIGLHSWKKAAHLLAARATAVARDAVRLCAHLDKEDQKQSRRRLN